MAKSDDKPCEPEQIDRTLDAVLVSALQENFEIKNGYHLDRSEMLEFLRSVIKEHPDLSFVLKYRDTKLSGRIYKAFPKVTTKRVAVPNIRGKKIWTYTNLRRISNHKGSQPKQYVKSRKSQITRTSEPKETLVAAEALISPPRARRERKPFKSKRSVHSASMVQRDSLFETYKRERNLPQQSYLGRFNDMLKWMKDHYVLEKNSSVQVKHIVECIKTEFKINITYKQSHKLIFAVFPGAATRVQDPVKIEAQGGFYSYRGIAPKPMQGNEESVFGELHHSPSKQGDPQNAKESISARQTWAPPCELSENGQKRVMRTRKRFIAACAVLKTAENALVAPTSYDVLPISSDFVPVASEVQHKALGVAARFSDVAPRFPEVPPMISDVSPMVSDMATIERENKWRRMLEDLEQERDQAIVERNQAMVSLMEIEREQPTSTRTPDDFPQRLAICSDVLPSATQLLPKTEERGREDPDWLQSLVSRSNIILGEQLSEANAGFFPGSTLQRSNFNQRFPKQAAGYSGEYLEIERYEQLKRERDTIWKNWMDKMKAEKDHIIQQLKLDKMEVIQRMELEKSDVVECVEEKLTNQITILTREMRQLKELLNHTMNERTLAIEHAHKLKELVSVEKLKEAGLENFPFDVTNDHVLHPPKQKTTDEIASQKPLVCLGKGNKRKQSMPAKLKKIPRLDSSVSTESEKNVDNVPGDESQTVSTEPNLLADIDSTDCGANADIGDAVVADSGSTSDTGITDVEAIDSGATDSAGTGQLPMVSLSPVTSSGKVLPDAKTAHPTPFKHCLTSPGDNHMSVRPFITPPRSVSGKLKQSTAESSMNVLDSETISLTEISKNLKSPACEDSNMDISENSFVASNFEKIDNEMAVVKAETIDSRNKIDIPINVCSNGGSGSEKSSPRSVDTSVSSFLGKYSTVGNLGISARLRSTRNSEKNVAHTGTSTNISCTLISNFENFSAQTRQIARASTDNVPLNIQQSFSESSENLYSSNSGKHFRELPRSAYANSNFQKYFNEIPKSVPGAPSITEIQKFSPGIPRTISASSDSEFLTHESPRSFEESVNSTFLKYFPELPKSSFNSPLTTESGKYFRGALNRKVCSSVCSDSEKYITNPGNQALVYQDGESFPAQKKVSSIDFLNSMVENIGKSSLE